MPSTSLKFRLRTLKHTSSRVIRHAWYRAIRIPAGQLAWALWQSSRLVSDRTLSRRNGIRILGDLTLADVPPDCIERFVRDDDVKRKFLIWPGDWDQRTRPMTEHYRYGPMQDLWQHRDHIEYSESYHDLIRRIENNSPLARVNKNILVDTPEKAEKHLLNQLEIFYSLAAEGYNPELADDELNVAIDRNGSLIKANGGRKRLIAAQILSLPTIPVRIAYVHKDWLTKHQTTGLNRSQALRRAISSAKALALDTDTTFRKPGDL